MNGRADNAVAGRLTGKQRCLRGARYFLAVFVAGVAFMSLKWHFKPWLAEHFRMLCLFCLPPALAVGFIVSLMRQRRRWHWVAMIFIAAAVVFVVPIGLAMLSWLR